MKLPWITKILSPYGEACPRRERPEYNPGGVEGRFFNA